MTSRWENLGTAVVVLAAVIPILFQATGQDNLLSLIIFGAMTDAIIIEIATAMPA